MITKEMREIMCHPDAYFGRLHARIERMKVRNIWWRLSDAEKVYCQLRSATGDDREAFKAAFPSEVGISPAAMKQRIYRLNRSRKVQRYCKTLDDAFERETMGKYVALKEKMVAAVLRSIEEKTKDDPKGVSRCRMEMFMLSRMLGWMPTEECGEEERHTPQAMTEEELKSFPMSERQRRKMRKRQQAAGRDSLMFS